MFLCILSAIAALCVLRWLLRKLRVGNYGDKYVFITGCDSGFGNLLAKRLDNLGLHVFAGCLTETGLAAVATSTSSNLHSIQLDVTKETSIANAVDEVTRKLPPGKGLWAVVNNAGIVGGVGPVDWQTRADYDITLSVNLYGVIFVTTAFLPLVRKATGRIVNISSIMGRFTTVQAPYTVSKFAVEGFSDTLRHELYSTGVTVHILEPGFFKTGLLVSPEHWRKILTDKLNGLPEHVRREYSQDTVDTITKQFTYMLDEVASPDLYKVVDAYTHAITARFPKARYVVGTDANFLFRLMWTLPEWISDYMVYRLGKV